MPDPIPRKTLLLTSALLSLTASAVAEAAVSIRIHCGGPAFTTPGGIASSTHESFIGGITGQNQSISDIGHTMA